MSVQAHARHDAFIHAVVTFSVMGLSFLIVGCGGDSSPSESSTSGAAPSSTASESNAGGASADTSDASDSPSGAEAPPAGNGDFSGRVLYGGDVPELAPLVKAGDSAAKDGAVCAAHDVPDESLVVDAGADHGLANVFVYLRRAPRGIDVAPAEEPVVLDQKGCRFFPHASIVRVGQTVRILSGDAIQHNVHTFPARNQGINVLITPNDREGLEVTYNAIESEPFQIKCDIHAWMSAYQLALDHPFAAVTDSEGRFRIEGLPAGKHQFRVWHEKGGFLERELEVDIKPDETTEVELTFEPARFAGLPVPVKSIMVSSLRRSH